MTLTRREFLRRTAASASGLVIGAWIPELARADGAAGAAAGGQASAAAGAADFRPNLFVRVSPDDWVTVTMIKHEMGQGVRTLLPMMVAEELDADWSRVRAEPAVTGPEFAGVQLHTGGSDSAPDTYEQLRRAGATARVMLVAAAAKRWGVPEDSCATESGAVLHRASGRRARFGSLAAEAAKLRRPANVTLKTRGQFKLLGTPVRRIDGHDIVTGRAGYGLDVRVPGMVFASVERAPVLGARLVSYDDTAARAMSGVIAVVPVKAGIQHGVAVVAASTWQAMRARSALKVEWDGSRHRDFSSAAFEASLAGELDHPGYEVRHEGDATAALAGAAKRLRASYTYPFQAHAPLEVMNCTADVRADRAEFWAPTQTQIRCLQQAVRVTGLPEDRIRVHATLMGGGFGRRLYADYLAEAAEISKAVARPVQVVWTREDDMRAGYFQPCTADRLTGGLDPNGRLVALEHRTVVSDHSVRDLQLGVDLYGGAPPPPKAPDAYASDGDPWGAFDNPYAIPNLKVDAARVNSPVPIGPWRSVMYPATVWARESFLDELAHLAGLDPLAFRLTLLPNGMADIPMYPTDRTRLANVHRLVAERAGWPTPPQREGRLSGLGLAANVYSAGSYIAQVADVSLSPDLSDLQVHRIVSVIDCGLVMNPLGLLGQAESAITWGLSYARHGRLEFRDGRAQAHGYDDFAVTRMEDMPPLDIQLVPGDAPPSGFGEHCVPMVAPAIANAVFAACGVRVRRLPITPEAIRAAKQG